MKILIANLNDKQELLRTEMALLEINLKEFGATSIFYVFNLERLAEAVNSCKTDIVLFTNFPPDSSYPESGKSIRYIEKETSIERYYEADGYKRSAAFFGELRHNGEFRAVHFITGAPKDIVPDEFLKAVFSDVPTTIKRRRDLIGDGANYNKLYLKYIESTVRKTR
jgi:hypothetical protein